jgi:hypothetical protein
MRRGLQKSVIGRLLAVIFFACAHARAQSQTVKISTLDLKNYGWQPLPKTQSGQRGERPGTRSQLVGIDHKGRVLVGFTARENYDLATREHPGLSFHIVRFTSEGRVDLSFALPTKDYFTNGFYLGSNDQIFARANDVLQVTSEQGEEHETRETDANWRPLASCPSDCYISHSFSRRTLILRTSAKPFSFEDLTYTILDTSSFPPRIVQTCSRMASYGEKITDKFEYWDGSEGRERFTRRFPFCDVDHAQEMSWTGGGGFFSLSDDAFLLLGSGKDSRGVVKLVGPDGRVKFQREMPNKNDVPQYSAGFWATSDERGDRFAFTVDTWRGGSRFFDISGKLIARRIVVYSDTGQELATFSVSTAYHRDFDFALSPDGHRLAILEEGIVTIADIK